MTKPNWIPAIFLLNREMCFLFLVLFCCVLERGGGWGGAPTGHSLPCLSRHHHPPDGSPVTKALPILQENDPFSSDWLFLFSPPVPPVSTGTLSHAGWYVPMP